MSLFLSLHYYDIHAISHTPAKSSKNPSKYSNCIYIYLLEKQSHDSLFHFVQEQIDIISLTIFRNKPNYHSDTTKYKSSKPGYRNCARWNTYRGLAVVYLCHKPLTSLCITSIYEEMMADSVCLSMY